MTPLREGRVPLAVDLRRRVHRRRHAAQGNTLIERDIVADLRRLADDQGHAMIDEQPAADHRAGVDIDAGKEAPEVGDDTRP